MDMEAWGDLKKKRTWQQSNRTLESKAQRFRSEIFHALEPINHVSRVCGLLPLKFAIHKFNRTSHGRIDFPLLIYGVSLALTLSGVECWCLYCDLRGVWQKMTLSMKGLVIISFSDTLWAIILTCFGLLDSPSRGKRVLHALDYIVQADEKLNFTTMKNLRKSSIILITCTLIGLVVISVFDYFTFDEILEEDQSPTIPFYLMQVVIVALQMEYAVILMNVEERFTKLNSTIEELMITNAALDSKLDYSPTFGSPSQSRQRCRLNKASIERLNDESDMTKTINQLIKVYDLLCNSIMDLNNAFGMVLLICSLGGLTNLVVSLYVLHHEFCATSGSEIHWYYITSQMIWFIFHIYKMFLVVQPPHAVVSKTQNTGSLVSQALAKNWNPQAQLLLESFAMQLLHRPVEFTACELFHVDRGLIASITGTAITYLAIILQYQINTKKETGVS